MENETGGKEMLELVNRYSILSEPTIINQNNTSLTSDSREKEEVVVGYSFPHFSAPADEILAFDRSDWCTWLPHSIPTSRQYLSDKNLLSSEGQRY